MSIDTLLNMPGSDDIIKMSLNTFFGGYGPFADVAKTTYTQSISNAFFAVTTVLSALATSVLAWHMLQTIVSIAQEGKVFGQKWSVLWGPVRVFTGAGMLAPVSGGFNIIQLLFMYVALAGCGLGNKVNSIIVHSGQAGISAPNLPKTGTFIAEMVKAETCYASTRLASSGPDGLAQINVAYPESYSTPFKSNISTMAGNAVNLAVSAISGTNYDTNKSFMRVTHEWNYGNCGVLSGTFASGTGHVAEFDDSRLKQIESVRNRLHTDITTAFTNVSKGVNDLQKSEDDFKDAITKAIDKAKESLDRDFKEDADTLVSQINEDNGTSNTEFSDAVNKYGWATFGPLYNSIASQQVIVSNFASQLPSLTFNQQTSALKAQYVDQQNLTKSRYFLWVDTVTNTALAEKEKEWTDESSSNANAQADITRIALTGQNIDSRANNLDSDWNKIFGKFTQIITSKLIDVKPELGGEITDIANFGSEISALGNTMIAAGVVGKVAEVTNPEINVVPGIGNAFNKVVSTGFVLSGVGAWHTYILPRYFSIVWFTLVCGYVTFIIAGVICVPFLAYLLCRLDGQEMFSNEHKAGISLFIHAIFTPVLLVLAGFFSIGLIHISFVFLQKLLYPALFAEDAGIFGVILMMLTICYLHTQIIMQSFRFPSVILGMFPRILGIDANGPGALADESGVKDAGVKAFAIVHSSGNSVGQGARAITPKTPKTGTNSVTEGAPDAPAGGAGADNDTIRPGARAGGGAGNVPVSVPPASYAGAHAGEEAINTAQQNVQDVSQAQNMGTAWGNNLARNMGHNFTGKDVAKVLQGTAQHLNNNPGASLHQGVRTALTEQNKDASDATVNRFVNAIRGESGNV